MAWRTTSVDGRGPLRVWEAGAGQPLVYLHAEDGHPGEAAFLQRFANGRRTIAPEHPGFGESGGFDDIDDMLDLTLHYRRFLETLDVGRVDLIGHALGGMLAAEVAALCPWLVRRLVLVAPYGLWLDGDPLPDRFVMSPDQLRAAKWADAESAQSEPLASASLHADAGTAAMLASVQNLGASTKFLWPIPDRGLHKRLPLIQAPTLVVMGERDGLIPPAYGEAFARAIPDARAEVLPGAAHLPMVEHADAFFDLVESFLAD